MGWAWVWLPNQSWPFFVAAKFNGVDGQYTKLSDSISGFKAIVAGEVDYLPEQAFLYCGTLKDAIEKGTKMLEENRREEERRQKEEEARKAEILKKQSHLEAKKRLDK